MKKEPQLFDYLELYIEEWKKKIHKRIKTK